jgi:hypothetical protein
MQCTHRRGAASATPPHDAEMLSMPRRSRPAAPQRPATGDARARRVAVLVLMACAPLAACADDAPAPRATNAPSCGAGGARRVVERLGARLRRVSLLAPDSVVDREIRTAYASLVTPELLQRWLAEPARAPGREVSSPWPERIEVRSVTAEGEGTCRVAGEVVYVTSAERAHGGAAARVPVTLRVTADGGWRISEYRAEATGAGAAPPDTPASASAGPDSTSPGPADVVRGYYAGIEAHDYRRAYALWGDGGRASGQTYQQFRAGFARTAHVEVEVGEPGRVEGAAGSRYVEVPVVVRARTVDGETQRFEGTYTLRRTVVDGATPAQRHWHLFSADLSRARE